MLANSVDKYFSLDRKKLFAESSNALQSIKAKLRVIFFIEKAVLVETEKFLTGVF